MQHIAHAGRGRTLAPRHSGAAPIGPCIIRTPPSRLPCVPCVRGWKVDELPRVAVEGCHISLLVSGTDKKGQKMCLRFQYGSQQQ